MLGSEDEYDGELFSATKLMTTCPPRGTGGSCYGVKIGEDMSDNYVGTKGMNTMELECKACRPGSLPSLCHSDLGRELDQGG